jgi:CHASE2 domain-containing sensor protein
MLGDGLARARNRLHAALHSPSDRKAILFVLAIAAGFLLLTYLLHLPHGPEHWSADFRTAHWSKHPATQHKRIALVYVSEQTLEPYPYLSPTDRQLLADLIKAVDAAGPTAIGFDFIIDRATEPGKDAALLAAVRDAKAAVVLGAITEEAQPSGSGKSYQAEYLEKANRSIGTSRSRPTGRLSRRATSKRLRRRCARGGHSPMRIAPASSAAASRETARQSGSAAAAGCAISAASSSALDPKERLTRGGLAQ